MQVLDTTIVNVALPNMQGSFSASSDQISWVLTSYLIATAIMMPLTGFLTDILGRKRYLLMSIGGFVISSMLCGMSPNLGNMILFRLLQGVFGAALVPLSQAIMISTYPADERNKAMAIWGMGIMVGPILGPTLGGYLTEYFNWRWTFYINVPIGILSLILCWKTIPNTTIKKRSLDWWGLAFISLFIASLQYILDRGNQEDWFNSSYIKTMTVLGVSGFIAFLLYKPNKVNPIFDIKIFLDRNFLVASSMVMCMGLGLYGCMVLQPILLEDILGYPTLSTGLLMAPRGFASMFSMMLVGKYLNKYPSQYFIALGITLSTIGSYACTFYSLEINEWWIIWPIILQGLGSGFIMGPLSSLALWSLLSDKINEAAGIFSLMRTLGSSIGISLVSTLFARQSQVAWNELGGFINPYNPALRNYLSQLKLTLQDNISYLLLAQELGIQSQIKTAVNLFMIISISFFMLFPLIFLLKKR